ncbi:N-glycosylase/DNA lyase [Candidatus Woesearchaeota archaeon]|nr:N-glycosylase/DNA lyase [Candidatus Woesearchaeota archaeon]
MDLIAKVNELKGSSVSKIVDSKIKSFSNLGKKGNEAWFSELCFCILTSNSKAQTAINIQNELGYVGFATFTKEQLSESIRRNKHRFHNNKSDFIILAREYIDIKSRLKKERDPRAWLVRNIKGIAWKESSPFLRNVGYTDYAILDRHIINLLHEMGYLKEKPKTLNEKTYLKIELVFKKLASDLNLNCSELDLYMWNIKTGTILK